MSADQDECDQQLSEFEFRTQGTTFGLLHLKLNRSLAATKWLSF